MGNCERDEIANHIISECNKRTQKECKTRNDWVGKVIHLELSKRLKFDNVEKCRSDNLSPKIRCIIFSGTLRYKRIETVIKLILPFPQTKV